MFRPLDDPNSNTAVRNLALDHVGSSSIFERNYLSRMLRYSTQDAFWNRESDLQAAKGASRIGRLRDPNRPKKLTHEQSRQVRQYPSVLQLLQIRDRVRGRILTDFGALKMAAGEPIYAEYQELGRLLNSTIRAEERALMRHIQTQYDSTAPVEAIQQQIREVSVEEQETPSGPEPIHIKIPERRRIAEAALSDPARFVEQKALSLHVRCSLNMIALCRRRERRREKKSPLNGRPRPASTVTFPELQSSASEQERTTPLKCQGYQCLFCLLSELPQEDSDKAYASKYSLQRHAERCRLGQFREKDRISCPDNIACSGRVFNGKSHFKNHAASVHFFIL